MSTNRAPVRWITLVILLFSTITVGASQSTVAIGTDQNPVTQKRLFISGGGENPMVILTWFANSTPRLFVDGKDVTDDLIVKGLKVSLGGFQQLIVYTNTIAEYGAQLSAVLADEIGTETVVIAPQHDTTDPNPQRSINARLSSLEGVRTAAAASAATITPAGWASVTGFRNAETAVQKRIVATALSQVNLSSGQSQMGGVWLTDCADGDGARMRAAINRYAGWYWQTQAKVTLAQIKAAMLQDFNGSLYDGTRKTALIERIVSCYNSVAATARSASYCPAPPTTDNATLQFLVFRKQCLEWADWVATTSGGVARNYSATAVTDVKLMRPGMGLFRTGKTHAMIITDIRWDGSGNPVEFKVAEANWAMTAQNTWQNPTGQIPWMRTIDLRSGETHSGNFVVSFQ